MNITSETPAERITAPVLAARKALAEESSKFSIEAIAAPVDFYFRGEGLVGLAQNVASAEALCQAQMQYREVCIFNPGSREAYLFDLIARGADDSWGGRKNDSMRSSFDKVRSWVSEQMRDLRYS